MNFKKEAQILLTNDDGIDSPGLWAAAEALSEIGYVTVAAPREQASGMGRSMPGSSDGKIRTQTLNVHGVDWTIYAVGGTPAQAVQHAILEIMPEPPDLVVAGINYGTNFGTGITVSGTVGAAMEGASHRIPSLAVSLETDHKYHLSHSNEVDFDASGHFTAFFARQMLEKQIDSAIEVLKIEVPSDATAETDWTIARLALPRFYLPTAPERNSWDEPGPTGYERRPDLTVFEAGTDVHEVLVNRKVAVTPISLDMTAEVDFQTLKDQMGNP